MKSIDLSWETTKKEEEEEEEADLRTDRDETRKLEMQKAVHYGHGNWRFG